MLYATTIGLKVFFNISLNASLLFSPFIDFEMISVSSFNKGLYICLSEIVIINLNLTKKKTTLTKIKWLKQWKKTQKELLLLY